MNPSSYDSSIEPPRPPTVDSPSRDARLGDESMESTSRMASRLQTGQGVDEGDPASKFCGEEKRLPTTAMNPTKGSLHKSHSNDEAMDSNNNNKKSTANNSLKSMLQLKSSRRSSWSNKTVDLPIATTPTTLESASRQRFARRNSYVSDMVMARTRASDVISQALQVPNAGYEEAAPSLKRHAQQQQQQQAAPLPKRRRYQRRNSFCIPETSRSSGEASGFSWKAMDFLYGRGQPQAPAAMGSNTGATTTDAATATTRPSCAD